MAIYERKAISEFPTLTNVDKEHDWVPVVDTSDTTAGTIGTTKKALVAQFIGPQGVKGEDGKQVEIGVSATHVRWRYMGEAWSDIIPLANLKGEKGDAGEEIELRISGGNIQWRYKNSGNWANLITLASLKGDKGEQGLPGTPGETGPANTLSIGSVSSGSEANATIVGTSPNQTLNLVLPKGDTGPTGPQGPTGADGIGVPVGGTTGQVLRKKSDTNYDTEWAAVTSGVSSVNGKTGSVTLTKSDIGLGNVDNTSDINKPVSTAQASAINAKYTKPASGIPKDDLTSTVRTSLNKADTALQSFTETDPTVPSWAKQGTKPIYTKEEIGLGNVDNTRDLNKPISTATQDALNGKQETLVSGTNIKTVNGETLLGSGDMTIHSSYPEITEAEIDTGTTSELKALSGRRAKYIIDKAKTATLDGLRIPVYVVDRTLEAGDIIGINYDTSTAKGYLAVPVFLDIRKKALVVSTSEDKKTGFAISSGSALFHIPQEEALPSVGDRVYTRMIGLGSYISLTPQGEPVGTIVDVNTLERIVNIRVDLQSLAFGGHGLRFSKWRPGVTYYPNDVIFNRYDTRVCTKKHISSNNNSFDSEFWEITSYGGETEVVPNLLNFPDKKYLVLESKKVIPTGVFLSIRGTGDGASFGGTGQVSFGYYPTNESGDVLMDSFTPIKKIADVSGLNSSIGTFRAISLGDFSAEVPETLTGLCFGVKFDDTITANNCIAAIVLLYSQINYPTY